MLLVIPWICGGFWTGIAKKHAALFRYLTGFMTVLALFELLSIPMVFAHLSLTVQLFVYGAGVVLLCGAAFVYERKKKVKAEEVSEKKKAFPALKDYVKSLTAFEAIYLIAFVLIVGVQVFCTVRYDMGYWNSDDASYVAISTGAIHDGELFLTDPQTGDYSSDSELKYMFSGIYAFYTTCSCATGVPPAVAEHLVFAVWFLLMAYGCYILLADTLFEERENRLLFLVLLALLYLMGKFSHYSVTFRLLGPIWQGKAILAVIIFPLLLVLLPRFLNEEFSWKRCLLLTVISMAAVALTLGGIVTMLVVPGVMMFVHFIKGRNFKTMLYMAGCAVVPAVVGLSYMWMR